MSLTPNVKVTPTIDAKGAHDEVYGTDPWQHLIIYQRSSWTKDSLPVLPGPAPIDEVDVMGAHDEV